MANKVLVIFVCLLLSLRRIEMKSSSSNILDSSDFSLSYLRSLSAAEVANLTRTQFVDAYSAYKQYAWGCDQLYPETRGCQNFYNFSLMWTPIDALDTMTLMALDDLVNETLALLCSTPFHSHPRFTFKSNQRVFAFDFFLRSLGGLLSAYHLLGEECLYSLALELADAIYPIFNEVTPSLSRLPWPYINLYTQEVDTSQQSSCPAVAGTHSLEYGIMSVLSGDLKYWNASINAMRVLYEAKSSSLGMVGSQVFINTTSNLSSSDLWQSTETWIDGGIDSYYEYIVKCWALFNVSECRDWWLFGDVPHNNGLNASIVENLSYYTNMNASNMYKNESTDTMLLWFKRVNMYSGQNSPFDWNEYDLYSAFYSGVLSLTAYLAKQQQHDEAGYDATLRLAELNQNANWLMWNLSHIEPYVFDFADNQDVVASYDLNPENFESNYYLYMLTNDTLYYDRALQYLSDLLSFCKCHETSECVGFTGLENVNTKQRSNSLASYFFAESLKYLYLTFMRNEADNPLPFDEYVFNTEAHPLPKKWGYKLQQMIHPQQ